MSAMSGERLRVWENLVTTMEVLKREVGRDLRDAAELSEAEFTVVAHLVRAGAPMRPSDCARSIGWESSRLSHQLGRLERRGLVRRAAGDPADARTSSIELTGAGRRTYRTAIGPHLRAAERWFGSALTDAQVAALGDVLDALGVHIANLGAADGQDVS